MQKHRAGCLEGPISAVRPWWKEADEIPVGNKEPLFRAALVEQIRQEIAAGTYDTEEKMEKALNRLLQRLDGEQA